MGQAEEPVDLFQLGFTCSEAVLSVFAKDCGLDRDMALQISQGWCRNRADVGARKRSVSRARAESLICYQPRSHEQHGGSCASAYLSARARHTP